MFLGRSPEGSCAHALLHWYRCGRLPGAAGVTGVTAALSAPECPHILQKNCWCCEDAVRKGIGRGAMSLLTLIFAPIVTVLYLILARLWIEFLANLYRIGDNTQKLVDQIPA